MKFNIPKREIKRTYTPPEWYPERNTELYCDLMGFKKPTDQVMTRPRMSYSEVAKKYNISKEWAYKIKKRYLAKYYTK